MSTRTMVAVFFLAALLVTAVCQAPGILALRSGAQPGGGVMLLMAIGSCGPTLVALALSAWASGRAGVRQLFARRGQPQWYFYLIAPFHILAAHLLGSLALLVVGQYTAQHLAYPPLRPEQIAIAIIAPLGEEYGWRGYALPRLQTLVSPITASLLIGAVWALWHLPTLFVPGASPSFLILSLPLFLAGSLIYTWLYNATGASMRILVLAHLGAHIDNVGRAASMGDGYMPFYATSGVLVLMALGLVATGRLAPKTALPALANRP